jgi:Zn-dependent peptidase ImmA (M78 family)
MTNEEITQAACRLRTEHQTKNPETLCRHLDIWIDRFPMGATSHAMKGLITRNARCCTISLNSDMTQQTQDIVTFHEIGHFVLDHHRKMQVCAFQDYALFDNASAFEDEANRFVAEYLLDTDETMQVFKDGNDFFQAASLLRVPQEILDYKMRMLRYYDILYAECPIYTKRNCMATIDCSGIEDDSYM